MADETCPLRPARAAAGPAGPAAAPRAPADPAAALGPRWAEVVPVPRATAREVEGRVVLERLRPVRGGLAGLGDRVAYLLSIPRVRLDDLGSATWRHLDGHRTVADVCAALEADLGDPVRPAAPRVALFLRQLHDHHFIDLA